MQFNALAQMFSFACRKLIWRVLAGLGGSTANPSLPGLIDESQNHSDERPLHHECDRRKQGESEADILVCIIVENEGAEVEQANQHPKDGSCTHARSQPI